VKLSEARPAVKHYVEQMSLAAKKGFGIELSKEQQNKMVNDILSRMEAQDTYDFVDP